jgi:cytochrome c biogenesis protein CcmG, thiol:disulfide interchange protein DsbE
VSTAPQLDVSPPAPEAPPVRRRHTARWLAAAVVGVLVVVSVVLATRPPFQASQVDSPLLGKGAPTLSGTTLAGDPVSLAQYRGRYVFVNFFASWCSPCQTEEPDLVSFDFQQSKRADGAALISVVFDDPDSAAAGFVSTWGARWPAVQDPGGVIANRYGVSAPPTTFLVDPQGRVVADFISALNLSQLDAVLAKARADAG